MSTSTTSSVGSIRSPATDPGSTQGAALLALVDHQFNQLEQKYATWCHHYEPELKTMYQRVLHQLDTRLLHQCGRRMVNFNEFCRWVYQNTLPQINPRSGQRERPRLDPSLLDRPDNTNSLNPGVSLAPVLSPSNDDWTM